MSTSIMNTVGFNNRMKKLGYEFYPNVGWRKLNSVGKYEVWMPRDHNELVLAEKMAGIVSRPLETAAPKALTERQKLKIAEGRLAKLRANPPEERSATMERLKGLGAKQMRLQKSKEMRLQRDKARKDRWGIVNAK